MSPQQQSSPRHAPMPSPHGQGGDEQPDGGVEPPPTQQRVGQQPDQDRAGQVGAQQVLDALPGGGPGAEAGTEALLRHAQQRHDDHAGGGESDAQPAGCGPVPGQQGGDRVVGDVRGEQEEADRDRPLRPVLGGLGHRPTAGEPPDDDHTGQTLDGRVQAESQQRHRPRQHRGDDRDRALSGHVAQRQPRQQPGAPCGPMPPRVPATRRSRSAARVAAVTGGGARGPRGGVRRAHRSAPTRVKPQVGQIVIASPVATNSCTRSACRSSELPGRWATSPTPRWRTGSTPTTVSVRR